MFYGGEEEEAYMKDSAILCRIKMKKHNSALEVINDNCLFSVMSPGTCMSPNRAITGIVAFLTLGGS